MSWKVGGLRRTSMQHVCLSSWDICRNHTAQDSTASAQCPCKCIVAISSLKRPVINLPLAVSRSNRTQTERTERPFQLRTRTEADDDLCSFDKKTPLNWIADRQLLHLNSLPRLPVLFAYPSLPWKQPSRQKPDVLTLLLIFFLFMFALFTFALV